MAGALFADGLSPRGQPCSMPSGLLYRRRGTPGVWKLYFDYEPAPTHPIFSTPPLEVPLLHGDEVSPLKSRLLAITSTTSQAPLTPPFHFLGVLVGRKETGGAQTCAMLRSGDGRTCLAGLSSAHLAKGKGPELYSNELTIEEFNRSIASHPVGEVLSRGKLVLEPQRRSSRVVSTPAAAAPAAAPAAATAAARAAEKSAEKAAEKASTAKARKEQAKAARAAEAARVCAEAAAKARAEAARLAAETAPKALPPLPVGSVCWYQANPSRARRSATITAVNTDGSYAVTSGGRQLLAVQRETLTIEMQQQQPPPLQPAPPWQQQQPPWQPPPPWQQPPPGWQQPPWPQQPTPWPQQPPWPQTPQQPPPQQAATPPSLLMMERELQVLEGEQAVDPANATRAGRISGLKHDIGRKRRRL